jgi:hypothetical protein
VAAGHGRGGNVDRRDYCKLELEAIANLLISKLNLRHNFQKCIDSFQKWEYFRERRKTCFPMYDINLIKFRLSRKDYTLAKVALELNVKRGSVSNALAGRITSKRILEAIEEIIGPLPKLEAAAA